MILLYIFLLGLYFLVFSALVALATVVVKKVWLSNKNKTVKYQNNMVQEERAHTYSQAHSKDEPNWYPTGWVFNEKTQLWEHPDYTDKEIIVKKVRNGPTYEEWKAAREKEQHPEE